MKLNSEVIKSIASETPTAANVFNNLAGRKRHRQETDIGRYRMALIREGVKIADGDYMNVWKKLQEAGAGTLIIGRHGNPDRFKWNYSVKDVGKLATDGGIDLAPAEEKTEEKKPQRRRAKEKEEVKREKVLYVPIRGDKGIQIELPGDFSEEEAELLSNALKTIAKSA